MDTTYTPSRWVLLSTLQKSIRRGDAALALRAALRLYQTEPATLLRRLQVIAVEDIGNGNLPLVLDVLNASPANSLALVERMAISIKDRSACDLAEAVHAGIDSDLCRLTTDLMHRRAATSGNPLANEIAILGYKLTREPLCFVIPLVAAMVEAPRWEADQLTKLPKIHGWPSYAFDMYVREGKSAYRLALKSTPTLKRELERWTTDPLGLLGHTVFVAESGQLDHRLVYPGSDEVQRLGELADVTRFGVPVERVDEIIDLVRSHLPDIHSARCQVLIPDTLSL